ncbi:hypothetical protein [Demequina activiva]|uniref:Uncharacterized protein n=1 Tax=Demequina activiva TaxID=1582364 RepID=A0A919Q1W8_9MICO|nr:hypothetical protein [Demequina activiva]GIG54697.1 hypothetical protein Dac01nite_14490 [Demequina activiva]
MSGAQENDAPTCPVHPYGYHARSHVVRGAAVLAEPSLVRLPARCVTLERELEDSGRVDDFVRQLWVIERAGRPGAGLVLAAILAVAGVSSMLLMTADALAAWHVGVAAAVAVLAGLVAERVAVRTHRTRLHRVYRWREYLGFQA